MAALKTNKRKNKPDSYTVKWVIGGGRPQGTPGEWGIETFDPLLGEHRDLRHAKLFRAAVEAAHGEWPENYVPGTGFVDPITYRGMVEAAKEEEQAANPPPAVLLSDYAQTWVARRAKDPTFGQVRKDRQYLRDFILPWFGDRDLLDPISITKKQIEDWAQELRDGLKADPEDKGPAQDEEEPDDELYDEEDEDDEDEETEEDPEGVVWIRTPKSPKTIRNIHSTLSALLSAAAEDTDLPTRIGNPCSRASLPKLDDDEGDEEMVFLNPSEFAILLEAMADDAKPLTLFLYGTGLRFSEATALRVRDFLDLDPKHPTFRVRRAWKQRAKDGRWYIGRPKTKNSKRSLALTPSQVEMIKELIKGRGKNEFLFIGPRGGRWTHSTYYSQRWRLAVYRAMRCAECRAKDWEDGVGRRGGRELTNAHQVWCGHEGTLEERPRPHDLRHSHVAALIYKNTHIKKIQERLGHASIQITMDRYGHLFPEMDEQLVIDLEDMLVRVSEASLCVAG